MDLRAVARSTPPGTALTWQMFRSVLRSNNLGGRVARYSVVSAMLDLYFVFVWRSFISM
jgi:hypothetical protein